LILVVIRRRPFTSQAGKMFSMRLTLAAVLLLGLVGCTPEEPGVLDLRPADPNLCPAVALPLPMHVVIDPEATDKVTAIADDGRRYHVYWAPGFQAAGTATYPEVRDPEGVVVARDGEVLDDYTLHGYKVCANGDSIFVLLIESDAT
jgi:hypothetical protein